MTVSEWCNANPVPPARTPQFEEWLSAARALGPGAVAELVQVLATEGESAQEAALLALRSLGLEAWAHGYGETFHYLVSLDRNHVRRITPAVRTMDRQPAEAQGEGDLAHVEMGFEFDTAPEPDLDARLDLLTVLLGRHGLGDVRVSGSLLSGTMVVAFSVRGSGPEVASADVIHAVQSATAEAGLSGLRYLPMRMAS